MQWFFAINDHATEWFSEMAKVAVISAKERSSLEPNCLFSGKPNSLTIWLEDNGVKVHFTEVPFLDDLSAPETLAANEGSFYHPQHAAGAFLRTIAFRFARDPIFLYTDCDVMFLDGQISHYSTNTISAANEGNTGFNSGVMLINREFFAAEFDELVVHLRRNSFYFKPKASYDQSLLNQFFADRWTRLPDEMNWRPWHGLAETASVVHFHGPKPHRVKAILDGKSVPAEWPQKKMIEGAQEAYSEYTKLFYGFLEKPSALTHSALHEGAAINE